MKMKRTVAFAILAGLIAWIPMGAISAQAQTVSSEVAADVHRAVEQYVKHDIELKEGFFLRDPQEQRVRDMALDYVHDGVEAAASGLHVVCVDFLSANRDRLDIDFYVGRSDAGDMEVSKVVIHKVNGTERK